MAEQEKPLPRPPRTPFGSKRRFGQEEDQSLMADELARAAAEGRLDEFIRQEVPDNEYARSLVSMMMGMTGMAGMPAPEAPVGKPAEETSAATGEAMQSADTAEGPSPEVLEAIQAGDVAGLMELLKKEHEKRTGVPSSQTDGHQPAAELPAPEKEAIDRLITIASDNGLTLDWVIFRALKLYAEEYGKTGRL
ncbi:MAG: hypothetical protein M0Z79_01705 [Nitrospiraceae bacterium]|nr:hypothetical protein [Nitrospiraceae bacterium]